MAQETILVADDDAHIRDVVCFALQKSGYTVLVAQDGQEALDQVARFSPDLLILDILMPTLDGMETCRTLRRTSDIPIIFLTSRDDEIDKVVGLELGADDYIAKPFSPRELVARVKAILRRLKRVVGTEPHAGGEVGYNGLRLDRGRFEVTFREMNIALTAIEFDILEVLVRSPGLVFTRDQLMNLGYSDGAVITDRTIDSHIRKIRSKFRLAGCDPVETVRGVGYRLGSWNS